MTDYIGQALDGINDSVIVQNTSAEAKVIQKLMFFQKEKI